VREGIRQDVDIGLSGRTFYGFPYSVIQKRPDYVCRRIRKEFLVPQRVIEAPANVAEAAYGAPVAARFVCTIAHTCQMVCRILLSRKDDYHRVVSGTSRENNDEYF